MYISYTYYIYYNRNGIRGNIVNHYHHTYTHIHIHTHIVINLGLILSENRLSVRIELIT